MGAGLQIVFITGYMDYIGQGYDVEALHYLLKPVTGEKLRPVLDRAMKRLAILLSISLSSRRTGTLLSGEKVRNRRSGPGSLRVPEGAEGRPGAGGYRAEDRQQDDGRHPERQDIPGEIQGHHRQGGRLRFPVKTSAHTRPRILSSLPEQLTGAAGSPW